MLLRVHPTRTVTSRFEPGTRLALTLSVYDFVLLLVHPTQTVTARFEPGTRLASSLEDFVLFLVHPSWLEEDCYIGHPDGHGEI